MLSGRARNVITLPPQPDKMVIYLMKYYNWGVMFGQQVTFSIVEFVLKDISFFTV